jgi:hypothetical protein
MPPETPTGEISLVDRVWKGGSFISTPAEMKSASRRGITVQQSSAYVGFRLARPYDSDSHND